ncbi:hypothetical protein DBV15_08081 [Temnothorax longispinosus]|uniref:Uncharacterized protein n=1 Tax=Temnothorax longispinosus TaxID=300112 RepID=A0A4S2JMI2_9HYME|nr:hypothetical protein DBV15_08081 [Temnothorax longispinosus]
MYLPPLIPATIVNRSYPSTVAAAVLMLLMNSIEPLASRVCRLSRNCFAIAQSRDNGVACCGTRKRERARRARKGDRREPYRRQGGRRKGAKTFREIMLCDDDVTCITRIEGVGLEREGNPSLMDTRKKYHKLERTYVSDQSKVRAKSVAQERLERIRHICRSPVCFPDNYGTAEVALSRSTGRAQLRFSQTAKVTVIVILDVPSLSPLSPSARFTQRRNM